MPDGTASTPGGVAASAEAHMATPAKPRRSVRVLVAAIVAVGALAFGVRLFVTRHDVSTDNAVVIARTVSVTPEIGGKAVRVHVKNHQLVERGALLIELDRTVFEQNLARARGELHQAEAQERQADLRLASVAKQHPLQVLVAREDQAEAFATKQSLDAEARRVEAQAASVEASLTLAKQELERVRSLRAGGAVSSAQLEQQEAKVAELVAEQRSLAAQLAAARSRGTAAAGAARSAGNRATMVVDGADRELAESEQALARARVEQARAGVALAEAELTRTRIVAPIRGVIEHLDTEEGALIGPSSPALAVVSTDDFWIEARVKETDITNVKPEQRVEIRIDAFGRRTLEGRVDGVGSATMSRFSALPADGSGAHFVRVTQRVPIRIRLDGRHEGMRAGLNAVVDIKATP